MRLLAVILVLIVTAGCDQATKHLARAKLSGVDSISMAGGMLELTLAENPGAFLSFGASLPAKARGGFFTFGVAAGLTALLVWMLSAAQMGWLQFAGMTLAWAGGISNLIDRFARGGLVTDFMMVRAGPLHTGIFNVADMAVMLGIAFLFIAAFMPAPKQQLNKATKTVEKS
jgi:signal peptidase II